MTSKNGKEVIMFRYKLNKSTFIIAAMVILLCLVAITGATLALFTSDANDGKIGINATAGNLKVDIVDASKNPSSLVGDVLDFIPKKENGKVLFEPGAAFRTEGFRIKNVGDIPLNYILYVSEDNSLSDDFYKAFDVYITTDSTMRDATVKLQEFDGKLNPSQSSEVYYLVFRMKETAGNEFKNRTFTGVGVTVCAVQGNVDID